MKRIFIIAIIISILGIINAKAYWPSCIQNGKSYKTTHLRLGDSAGLFDGSLGIIKLTNGEVEVCNFTIYEDDGAQLVSVSTQKSFSEPDSNGKITSMDSYGNEIKIFPMKKLGDNVYVLTFTVETSQGNEEVSVIFDTTKVIN